jgi:hypothetical protein
MRVKLQWLIIITIIVGMVSWAVYAQRPDRKYISVEKDEWEYKVEGANDTLNAQKKLNTLGEEGWELVSVQSVTGGNPGTRFANMYFFLKRKRTITINKG